MFVLTVPLASYEQNSPDLCRSLVFLVQSFDWQATIWRAPCQSFPDHCRHCASGERAQGWASVSSWLLTIFSTLPPHRDLSFNGFNSTIPSSYSAIRYLSLENNALRTPLPAFLQSQPQSQVLLSNNSFVCPLVRGSLLLRQFGQTSSLTITDESAACLVQQSSYGRWLLHSLRYASVDNLLAPDE